MPSSNDKMMPAGPSRIGPLANLPIFFKLEGKRVVLAGGTEAALWKAELLAAAGGTVDVISKNFAQGFSELAAAAAGRRIRLVERQWTAEDLTGAAVAVGSFADDTEAAAFASAARSAGVPVNVIDRPAFCDFQFGAIVNRSPLIVGISTDGASPVFGQAIRSLIEALLPESFALWAAAARDLRKAGGLGDTPEKRRNFWRRFADYAIRNSERGPTPAELDQLAAPEASAVPAEIVTIIAVESWPDALTLGAVRALRAADDLYFDEGIPLAVTDFARREAQRHPVGNGEAGSEELCDALIVAAREGRRVVRLTLRGDTGDESETEVGALREAGIPVALLSAGSAFSFPR